MAARNFDARIRRLERAVTAPRRLWRYVPDFDPRFDNPDGSPLDEPRALTTVSMTTSRPHPHRVPDR